SGWDPSDNEIPQRRRAAAARNPSSACPQTAARCSAAAASCCTPARARARTRTAPEPARSEPPAPNRKSSSRARDPEMSPNNASPPSLSLMIAPADDPSACGFLQRPRAPIQHRLHLAQGRLQPAVRAHHGIHPVPDVVADLLLQLPPRSGHEENHRSYRKRGQNPSSHIRHRVPRCPRLRDEMFPPPPPQDLRPGQPTAPALRGETAALARLAPTLEHNRRGTPFGPWAPSRARPVLPRAGARPTPPHPGCAMEIR